MNPVLVVVNVPALAANREPVAFDLEIEDFGIDRTPNKPLRNKSRSR